MLQPKNFCQIHLYMDLWKQFFSNFRFGFMLSKSVLTIMRQTHIRELIFTWICKQITIFELVAHAFFFPVQVYGSLFLVRIDGIFSNILYL